MHIMMFTERPYYDVPEDEIIKNAGYFGIPNEHFNAEVGGQLYNSYFDEAVYAEQMGFDGVMLNEHHGTPFCMGAVMNIEAAVLARITERVKIVLLGNPLPVADPLRLAEELAMIDMISGGRLVPGLGAGRGQRVHLQQRQPGLQPGAVQRGPRLRGQGLDHPWPLPLRGQALPLPSCEPVGAAGAEALSADVDSRPGQPGNGDLVRPPPLSVPGPGNLPRADAGDGEAIPRHGSPGRLRVRPGELRLPATGGGGRDRGEGPGVGPRLHVWRRHQRLRPPGMDVPAGLQLQGGHPSAGPRLRQPRQRRGKRWY